LVAASAHRLLFPLQACRGHPNSFKLKFGPLAGAIDIDAIISGGAGKATSVTIRTALPEISEPRRLKRRGLFRAAAADG
jgi:hypothetical protein